MKKWEEKSRIGKIGTVIFWSGVAGGATFVGFSLYKNSSMIGQQFSGFDWAKNGKKAITEIVEPSGIVGSIQDTVEKATSLLNSEAFKKVTDNLTGEMLNATQLGRMTGHSNREINKIIINLGLAEKITCGPHDAPILTEAGQKVAKVIYPENYGFSYPMVIWDKAIIQLFKNAA